MPPPPDPKLRLLLTGAAGQIGAAFLPAAAERYQLRLADRSADGPLLAGMAARGHEVHAFEAADPDACQALCQGMDVVVHLAADPSPGAGFYPSLLENNVKGAFNLFRAARDQGCRRVVFASSAQAVEGYPDDVQIGPGHPVRPKNLYGVSKCFGEALAGYFAFQENLSCLVVRIGKFMTPAAIASAQRGGADHPLNARDLSVFLSPRDLIQLLTRCVEAPADLPFGVIHGISNNRFKRLDLAASRELIGYEPQDDAFEVFGIGLEAG